MNIETANRLYQYRKNMGISQEELAGRIGVSRQAVSKWERAEASPDTDNLIELAKVYGVTLDQLLQGEAEQAADDSPRSASEAGSQSDEQQSDGSQSGERVSFSRGINVDNEREHVHVGFDGIHVLDKHGTKVDIDRKNGIFVTENGEQKVYTDADGHIHKSEDILAQEHKRPPFWLSAAYPVLVTIAYLLFGSFGVCGGWGYGWIIFLTIPLYYSVVEAISKRDADRFAYPVFAVIAFLIMGFVWGLWHPGWIVFVTIPAYYAIVNSFKDKTK